MNKENMIYTNNGILSVLKKKEILPTGTAWVTEKHDAK
jgi:hypothetical protein